MTTNIETKNLVVNVIGLEDYNSIQDKNTSELYIVKENSTDGDNAIAGKSYVDTIRKRVYTGSDEPNPNETSIWIDISDDGVDVGASADVDLTNLSDEGKNALYNFFVPDYETKISIGNISGETYDVVGSGYMCIQCNGGGKLVLKKDNELGPELLHCECLSGNSYLSSLCVGDGMKLYFDERIGDVDVALYPIKGLY
jgi:hypothetical protein